VAQTKSKHPPGLYRLFFTEMWERLAFYTMLNILLLYATDFERGGPRPATSAEGNEIYGLYLAFVYFTPFPGGHARRPLPRLPPRGAHRGGVHEPPACS
jgi:dipeptide/tripeptide permease